MRQARHLPGYMRAAHRLGIGGTTAGRKIAAAEAALERANDLPGPSDVEGFLPPTIKVWARRVPGAALWIWYSFTSDTVWLRALTTFPPPS